MLSRTVGGAGRAVRDAALYGGMTFGLGYLLENMHTSGPKKDIPSDPPHPDEPGNGPFAGALDGLMHGASDTIGFLGSLPGDIIGGISDAYETSKMITYLITAGLLVGGGVYLYRMRTE